MRNRPSHSRRLNSRDLALLAENWEQSDDIAMDNPLGGIKRGWSEIREVYERIFRGSARLWVEFYDYTLHESDHVFYAIGRGRGRFENGPYALDLTIRATRIFRRSADGWRALLAAYQQATR